MKKKVWVALIAAFLLITGMTIASNINTPNCFSDTSKKATLGLSKTAFINGITKLTGKQAKEGLVFDVVDIRDQSTIDSSNLRICAATLRVKTPQGQTVEAPFIFSIEKMEGFANFYYTVSITDIQVK